MFLRFIKNFALKKYIKKCLSGSISFAIPDRIVTVGIIVDESYFSDREALVEKLASDGIKKENIETLSFKEKVKSKEVLDYLYYSRKNISSTGIFLKEDVAAFINKPFDMLINYYDVEKPALLLATVKSKAKFKVGFSNIDNRFNSFMISTEAEKYTEFASELLKYLKILNKI